MTEKLYCLEIIWILYAYVYKLITDSSSSTCFTVKQSLVTIKRSQEFNRYFIGYF